MNMCVHMIDTCACALCLLYYSCVYNYLCIDSSPALAANNLNVWFSELSWEHYMLWKVIGEELGIDAVTLSSIERSQAKNTSDYLHRMINEANPPITQNAMATALRSKRVTNAIAGMSFNHD